MGILTTLREEFIDIFERDELRQKIEIRRLPIPVLFAMQDVQIKKEIEKILTKKNLANKDIEKVVDLTLGSKDVQKLKKNMEDLVGESVNLMQVFNSRAICLGLQSYPWTPPVSGIVN